MQSKILLSEDQLPKQWYNIIPDMPGEMAPVIHPGTLQPVSPDDLLPLFPMGLIEQEVSQQRWIDIPEEVREIYKTVASFADVSGASAGKSSRYAGQDLLQV